MLFTLLACKPCIKLFLFLSNDLINAGVVQSLLENRKGFIDIDLTVDQRKIVLCTDICAGSDLIGNGEEESNTKPSARDDLAS